MELSVRREFGSRPGCDTIQIFSGYWSWQDYLTWIKLGQLNQVRTYDTTLNPILADSILVVSSIEEVQTKSSILAVDGSCQYVQLAINTADEEMLSLPNWIRLLGYDLVESDFAISSLLNCGPWEGELAHFTPRLNQFGLLDFEEVKQAELLLPVIWGEDEPHAFADVWAICEVSR